jgi:uncharacterized ferritin-like protein (DUF455 family)
MELRAHALHLLALCDPAEKAAATLALPWGSGVGSAGTDAVSLGDKANSALASALQHQQTEGELDPSARFAPNAPLPGRPPRPALIPPMQVPRRSPFTPEGLAGLLHSVAHIEFNAINLALDAVWRFPDLPQAYYRDWLQVAREEAHHFTLLSEHLATLGHRYGDFDAHDGLWAMCERTAHDPLARMALVPRTLEARGLDATPPMQAKLRRAGDHRAVEILDVILRDEIGHVAIGNRWYAWLCAQQGLDPVAHYPVLAARHDAPRLRAPFNLVARRAAGFSETELAQLA